MTGYRLDTPDDQDSHRTGQPLTDVQCDQCGTWTSVTLQEAENSDRILCDMCAAEWRYQQSKGPMPSGWDRWEK